MKVKKIYAAIYGIIFLGILIICAWNISTPHGIQFVSVSVTETTTQVVDSTIEQSTEIDFKTSKNYSTDIKFDTDT